MDLRDVMIDTSKGAGSACLSARHRTHLLAQTNVSRIVPFDSTISGDRLLSCYDTMPSAVCPKCFCATPNDTYTWAEFVPVSSWGHRVGWSNTEVARCLLCTPEPSWRCDSGADALLRSVKKVAATAGAAREDRRETCGLVGAENDGHGGR